MRFSRTEILVGEEGIAHLRGASVAIAGLGGVGSYAAEAIVRAGVGRVLLIDCDSVEISNLNRQLIAMESTLGRPKVEVAAERFHDINPSAEIIALRETITPENVSALIPPEFDCVIDAIDTVASKIALLATLHARGASFVSCMGAASRLNPSGILVADIRDTAHCALARIVRKELRTRGIEHGVRCVYSQEYLNRSVEAPVAADGSKAMKRRAQGSISYVPGIIGLTAAGLIVNDILTGR